MVAKKKQRRKRKVATLNVLTGEVTPVRNAHKTVDPGERNDWESLEELIQGLADAQEADSWKGGGDPDEIPVIEMQLNLAKLKLRTHIDKMRRYYEGTQ